ncbi:MAG: hypothetical protein ACXQT4_02380 [Methanotrichaceae archaeon]
MFIFVAVLVLIFTASASEAAINYESIEHGVELYNANMDNAPGVVKVLLGDEKIEITINRDDGTDLITGLYMKNSKVANLVEGKIDDPTIVIKSKEDTIIRILESEDSIRSFQQAKKDGDITITGKTIKSKLKLTVALSSTTALKFFTDLIPK